jgi:exopolysaccharide biosynthesis polyprenyl glycosylphosphotransferase
MFAFRPAERRTLLIVIDFVIVELTTLLAFWIMAFRAGWAFNRAYLLDQLGWFIFLPALWFFSAFLNGFYGLTKLSNLAVDVSALARTVVLVVIVYLFIYFLSPAPLDLPRGIVAYQGTASFLLIGAWRTLYVLLLRRPEFARKVIIIGAGWAGKTIAQVIHQYAGSAYQIVGFIDDDPAKQEGMIAIDHSITFPVLGTRKEMRQLVQSHQVSEVVLAITHDLPGELVQALLDCQSLGVQITLMPLLYEQITGRVPIQHIGDNWNVALPLDHAGTGGLYPLLKRTLDILGALIGLVLYAPLFPFLALAIYADSPGPIFYRQERVGKGGKIFRLIKLRTMVPDAEKQGAAFTTDDDPRMTRVGRFLRKTRLDEFPQLINVLLGDMSAVGPRALSVPDLQRLENQIPFHRMRYAVRPGMAGWAQVNYGHPTSVEEARIRLEYDLYYIKHQSLWLDLLILLRMMGQALALRGR